MKKQGATGLLAVAAVIFVACLGGCYLGIGLSRSHSDGVATASGGLTHEQFHQALGLSAKQEKALLPLEAKSNEREMKLRDDLNAANAELAEVLIAERSYSPKVERSVEKIHKAMAELQKATLEHLFEMEKVLTPEQYDQLLKLAGESLPHSH
ncbi:MAG: periplasmic heavy metal sensor [Verrucomicrobiales bacterium]|nr:periplasmic heavy metal sensor [Verrucomicrobiales bacterium]